VVLRRRFAVDISRLPLGMRALRVSPAGAPAAYAFTTTTRPTWLAAAVLLYVCCSPRRLRFRDNAEHIPACASIASSFCPGLWADYGCAFYF